MPLVAECRVWDSKRDLALAQVVAVEAVAKGGAVPPFAFIRPAAAPPKLNAPLVCVGQPGAEDLEAATPGRATGYELFHISRGRFRGLVPGVDVDDNAEMGVLMHDCWTYWGHSGAGLVSEVTGELVGVHSSWDEGSGMRRGVAWECVWGFLKGVRLGVGVEVGGRVEERMGMSKADAIVVEDDGEGS